MTPKKFNTLTKAQQRVEIAKDVIAQIEAEKYIPKEGNYIVLRRELKNKDLSIQENFNKINKCKVCAIGSAILSIAKFKNTITTDDIGDSAHDFTTPTIRLLKSVFTPKQIALIEASFEGYGCNNFAHIHFNERNNTIEYNKTRQYYSRFKSQKARLIGIMENIISNKGSFRP